MFGTSNLTGLFHQLIAGFAASLSAMASSAIYGWLTPILPILLSAESEIPMTPDDVSWLVAMPQFGRFLSPVPSGVLADRIGRKAVIMISGLTYLLGWTTMLYFKTRLALNIGNFLHGLGNGIVITVLPMYLGEIATPNFRGVVLSTYSNLWWFGYLFEFIIGPYLSFTSFTYVTALISVIFLLTFVWQPETPYYYLMKNNESKAKASLSWYSCSSEEDTNTELTRIKQSIQENMKKKVNWTDLFVNPINRKCMIVVLLTSSIRLLCGVNSLASYSTETLTEEADDFFMSPDSVTIVMGASMCIGSLASSFTLDLFGRRYLFFVSCLISAICMIFVGTFYLFKIHSSFDLSYLSWISPFGIIIFSATSVIGIFSVAIAYQTELFDTKTRAVASSISVLLTSIVGLLSYKTYEPISFFFGDFVNFYVFAVVCLFGAFISFTLIPETKGKSFEQIREEFQCKSPSVC